MVPLDLMLAFVSKAQYTNHVRKYLDIPITVIVAFTLTTALLWPLNGLPPTLTDHDKVLHLVAFAALAFPMACTGRVGMIHIFISASAFGGAIELMQINFNRNGDFNDWIADAVGVLIGIACGLFYRRLRQY